MVQMAYRTKYCGWTLEQAAREVDRSVGLVTVNHGPDYRHMVSFYQNRVLPLRRQRAQTTPAQTDRTARAETPAASSPPR
jgi:hypothetical protein